MMMMMMIIITFHSLTQCLQEISPDFDIKQLVESILQEAEASDKRARTMDLDDFMNLLYCFNKHGIHFS